MFTYNFLHCKCAEPKGLAQCSARDTENLWVCHLRNQTAADDGPRTQVLGTGKNDVAAGTGPAYLP